MPEATLAAPERRETDFLRTVFLAAAVVYPLWHLACPRAATDPWWAWFAVAASFFVVGGLSFQSRWLERHLLAFFHVCSALVTLQLFLLAYLNDMHPFYAIGSVMAVVATVLFIRSPGPLLAYAGFVTLLGATLYALSPDPYKLAYWGGLLTVVAAWYLKLVWQEASARAAARQREDLERRVHERTRELADANRRLRKEIDERGRLEQQLRLAQTMEVVGRLAGGVAHEFNNLLTTMRLYGELLEGQLGPDSPLLDDLTRIQEAGREAADLTQQLLDFSRGSSTRPEVLDLNEAIERLAGILRPLAGEDVLLELDLAGATLPIHSDRGQLERILVNLVLNARDAMPHGGRIAIQTSAGTRAELRARHLPVPASGDELVVLSVSDTGIGMDAATRARAFEPFFTQKPVGEGTGLGLSIVYGIVAQGEGTVHVESEPGKGSRFDLIWPRSDLAPNAARPESAPSAPRGTERLLLVEDEHSLLEALARLLRAQGYEVETAADAYEAITVAGRARTPFDLVVTDVVMPGMSGPELVERLVAKTPSLESVFLSGHANHPSLRGREVPRGAPLLRKPFEPYELGVVIRRVLDARPA